ncbi:MAG: ABC transporter ATP-binding protein [Lachnospiraceae bacterium]|nr:ABC transporter ATP-binding protein [Lachnospiraceae bacterium]
MRGLGKYFIKYKWHYLFALVCLYLGIYMDLQAPKVIGRIIDDVLVGGQRSLLMQLVLMLLGVGIGRGIFKYLQEFTSDCIGVKIAEDIRRNLFGRIQKMSVGFFEKNNTGELMARVKDDAERIWEAMGFVGLLCVEAIVHTIMVLTNMIRIDPLLTLVPLCIMPLVGYIAVKLEKGLDKVYDDISEENAELNTVAQENLNGVRTVKAFFRGKHEIEKFRKHNSRYYDLNMRLAKTMARYNPNISFLTKVMLLLSVTVGGMFVVQSRITLGQLGTFIEYANNIVWPMEILGWVTNSMAAAIASNKKINKILEAQPEIYSPEDGVKLPEVKGELTFNHVSLELQGQRILEDVNFKVEAGKTLGIMGVTGSGKTTIVNLAERFYDVSEGEILLDGVDVRKMDLNCLRKNMSVVMQDVFLFSDTVAENIRIGSRDVMTDEVMVESAKQARAFGFVDELPEKFETVIGEKGVGLSGGQKQRLSIARALAKHAPILFLDDSTSALDMETEHEIQRELNRMEGITKVIIAHRISAVRHADEIMILEDGRIVERGTHDSLMELKGRYYDTFVAQYERPEELMLCL